MFGNPIMARAATWYSGGVGAGTSVRVITKEPDAVTGYGTGQLWSETMMVDIRVFEAPSLAEGDELEIGGARFVVQGEPKRDRDRLIWTAELVPV